MPRAETSYIALLRGVNVGGNKSIAMVDLRDLAADLGFTDPHTLLQSGNLVFRTAAAVAGLERLLERETHKRLGIETDFLVRSASDWNAIIAGNPFLDEARRDPGHLVVMCFKDAVAPKHVEALQASITGPEIVRARGTHAYITYPAGQGTSRLTTARIDKALGTRGTARNWNTVLKLAAVASAPTAK
jgi:uncharacterized protein (DUF1697 family)